MRLLEFLDVMRRWRAVILAGVLIGVVVGWVSAPGQAATTTTFEATHTLILDRSAGRDSEVSRAAVLATLGAVPGRVAARLGLERRQVQSMVSAGTRSYLDELFITATSADGAQAEALADVTAEELIVEFGGQKGPLRTLEPAVASLVETEDFRGPTSSPGRALLLGVFGLVLGVGAAFGVERFDRRIRSGRAAEDALGFPVVAEVPPIPRSAPGLLLTGTQPSSFIEAYRGLRTVVARRADAPTVIVVTSASAGEGKTTTVAHLAVTLAEAGHSVLAISADLRRPRLHLYFDRPPGPGVVEVMTKAPTLAGLDLSTSIKGLHFLGSGAPVDSTSDLLRRAGELMGAARSLCDFVLVDTPPLLTATDAADLARHADGVLFVVRAGRTSTTAAKRSAELLERLSIPVIGAVLVGSDAVASWYRRGRPVA